MGNHVKAAELVALGLYGDEQDVIDDGIRRILRSHPEYRREIAVQRYDKEEISLGKAADIAGVSLEEMKQILMDRGIGLKSLISPDEIMEDANRAKRAMG